MVVLDVGVNDYYTRPCLPVYLADSMAALVKAVQEAVPEATVILCSQQPNYYKKRLVAGAIAFSQTLKNIAASNRPIGLYDYFTVTNTRYAVLYWQGYKLMQKDGAHLSHAGYRHKSELFTNALLGAYQQFLLKAKSVIAAKEPTVLNIAPDQGELATILNIGRDSEATGGQVGSADSTANPNAMEEEMEYISATSQSDQDEPEDTGAYGPKRKKGGRSKKDKKSAKTSHKAAKVDVHGAASQYVIQRGDNLSSIARKFHLSVASLQKANGLSGAGITAGKTLVIPKR
jgi:LysM repeat protein